LRRERTNYHPNDMYEPQHTTMNLVASETELDALMWMSLVGSAGLSAQTSLLHMAANLWSSLKTVYLPTLITNFEPVHRYHPLQHL